jgi:hypothetical protein
MLSQTKSARSKTPMANGFEVFRNLFAASAAFGLVIGAAMGMGANHRAAANDLTAIDITERFLAKIPAGIEVGKTPPKGWTHLVFVATPQVVEGDVDALPSIAKNAVSLLQLTVLANAVREGEGEETRWRLDKVAAGFATKIGAKRVVVDSASQSRLGANFDFIERSVLSSQEKYLAQDRKVLQIVTAPNMVVFDATQVMPVDGKHRERIVRHAIVVDAKSGGMGALVWLLKPATDRYELVEDQMHLLPANLQEKRRMRVDGSQVNFLGMPSPKALAVIELPEGTPIEFSEELREVAALERYTPASAAQLEAGIWSGLATAGVK